MKISHKELETCFQSPKAWVTRRLAQEDEGGGPRFSYKQALTYALGELHATRDLQTAAAKLEGYLNRFKNELAKQPMRDKLTRYSDWLDNSGIVPLESNVTLNFPLSGDWHLGGSISRVDLTTDGYRAIIFDAIMPEWKKQIRMPLIQLAIAERYGRPAAEVRVGFQDLTGNEIADHKYGKGTLTHAKSQFSDLGDRVRRLMPTI